MTTSSSNQVSFKSKNKKQNKNRERGKNNPNNQPRADFAPALKTRVLRGISSLMSLIAMLPFVMHPSKIPTVLFREEKVEDDVIFITQHKRVCVFCADCRPPWPSHLFVCSCRVAERFRCGCEVCVCVWPMSCGSSPAYQRSHDRSQIKMRSEQSQLSPSMNLLFIFAFVTFHTCERSTAALYSHTHAVCHFSHSKNMLV